MFITCYYNFSREPYFMREFCCGSIFLTVVEARVDNNKKALIIAKKNVMRFMIFFCY